ncbi:MAG: hypothetical protein NTW21_02280 [Verrucomicrobia bacterium]|nr:hypothetical protein [Verrucomicrobiota bacterium]
MNLSVQTPDEWLAALHKPSLQEVAQFELAPDDWLVVCGGFEDRVVAILQNAISARRPFNVLLVHYEPFSKENRSPEILEIAQGSGLCVVELTYNRQAPEGFGMDLLRCLSGCRGRILVDVSAMSRLLIVQILVALGSQSSGFANCYVAYAEARDYPPSREEAVLQLKKSESDPSLSILFLSSGVFDVTVVPELASVAPSAAHTRLIAFPSLDAHQLTATLNEIQPSRLSLIEGMPPDPENKWRMEMISKVNQLDKIPNAQMLETSTLDYRETLDCLLKLYADHGERDRILVSPTGSKMQTVAVGIFRSLVKDIQIVYPTPGSYIEPDRYTLGVGLLYLLPLDEFLPPPQHTNVCREPSA